MTVSRLSKLSEARPCGVIKTAQHRVLLVLFCLVSSHFPRTLGCSRAALIAADSPLSTSPSTRYLTLKVVHYYNSLFQFDKTPAQFPLHSDY